MIARIIVGEVSFMCQKRRLRRITQTQAFIILTNDIDHARNELNNRFIMHSLRAYNMVNNFQQQPSFLRVKNYILSAKMASLDSTCVKRLLPVNLT